MPNHPIHPRRDRAAQRINPQCADDPGEHVHRVMRAEDQHGDRFEERDRQAQREAPRAPVAGEGRGAVDGDGGVAGEEEIVGGAVGDEDRGDAGVAPDHSGWARAAGRASGRSAAARRPSPARGMAGSIRRRCAAAEQVGAEQIDPAGNYNYGQLQIRFQDGSVGWYEAGWGPMISETAFFIKDVFGPKGSVSIVAKDAGASGKSASVESHTKTESLKFHHAELDKDGNFAKEDTWINLKDEPDHQELCNRQQQYFLESILEDKDLDSHAMDAVNSLRIAFACDESVRTGKVVSLL